MGLKRCRYVSRCGDDGEGEVMVAATITIVVVLVCANLFGVFTTGLIDRRCSDIGESNRGVGREWYEYGRGHYVAVKQRT